MTDIDYSFLDEYDGLPPEVADDFRSQIDKQTARLAGSSLRKESEKNAAAAEKYRNVLLEKTFADLGIPGKPAAYRGVDTLDPTDATQVKSWGTEMGLIAPPPDPTPDPQIAADLLAQQRIEAAAAGGQVDVRAQLVDDLNSTTSEAETLALLQRAGASFNSPE